MNVKSAVDMVAFRFRSQRVQTLWYSLCGVIEEGLLRNAFATPALVRKFLHVGNGSVQPFKAEYTDLPALRRVTAPRPEELQALVCLASSSTVRGAGVT
jgi:hypothetical protein